MWPRCATSDACWTRLDRLLTLGLPPIGKTMMRKAPASQQTLFEPPTKMAETRLPQNVQTAPVKLLLQALLTGIIDAQRAPTAVPKLKE